MFDQIRFVQTNDRSNSALGGTDEIAVDQVRLEVRLNQRHDDNDLIDVGDNNVLPATGGAGQEAVPRLDSLDESLVVGRGPNPNAIAGRDDVALIGGERAEESTHRTAELAAVVGGHDVEEAVLAEHSTRQTRANVHGRHFRRISTVPAFRAFILNNGSPP